MVLLYSPLFSTVAAENSAAKLVQIYLKRETVCRWWVSRHVCAAQHWNPLSSIKPNVIMSWIFLFVGGFFLSFRCGLQEMDKRLVSEKPVGFFTDNKILPFTSCSAISLLFFLCLRTFLKSKYSGKKHIISSFDFHMK